MQKEIISEWYNGVEYHNRWGSRYLMSSNLVGRKYRRLHQQKWYDANGEIPEGYHIHHKDEDRFNNSLENLECIPAGKHLSDHMRKHVEERPEWFDKFQKAGIAKATEWHKSEEGKQWHIEHAAKIKFGKFDYGTAKCEFCEGEYNKKTMRARFCTNNCKSKWRRQQGIDDIDRTCKCGVQFRSDKYCGNKLCESCRAESKRANAYRCHESLRHKREEQAGVLRERDTGS